MKGQIDTASDAAAVFVPWADIVLWLPINFKCTVFIGTGLQWDGEGAGSLNSPQNLINFSRTLSCYPPFCPIIRYVHIALTRITRASIATCRNYHYSGILSPFSWNFHCNRTIIGESCPFLHCHWLSLERTQFVATHWTSSFTRRHHPMPSLN